MRNLAKLLGISSGNPEADKSVPVETVEMTDESDAIYEVQHINPEDINPNPFQPRKTFNDESLQELASSIREFGIIQPLLVRRTPQGMELVAGERRLRASKLAGLQEVPVIVKEMDDKEMAELAMIENLQREDLHFLEEAEGFNQLLSNFGMTQDELARRVGKNQSTIANKLRLLKLPPLIRRVLKSENLTERHARALLKLEDPQLQIQALDTIHQKGLNVRETEGLVEDILEDISREMSKKKATKQNVVKVIKDVRIFLNTINRVVADMKKVGIHIKVNQEQDDEYIMLNLKIPKRR
ncbi:parb/sulfiredoxin [Lucifera butyrica]|uniref:Parb/sulfiredoxin n=1 Tax=Lucifera butyrica TaxID=1351585 RepID=A0A498R961_9FIRM|nr:nucleoid occlusion protein [Lucifera butyrica]VBB07487.1 parb/sulfiredoxin [Lucifera butyrica]